MNPLTSSWVPTPEPEPFLRTKFSEADKRSDAGSALARDKFGHEVFRKAAA